MEGCTPRNASAEVVVGVGAPRGVEARGVAVVAERAVEGADDGRSGRMRFAALFWNGLP